MQVVGICGKARAGKDTVANMLCEVGSKSTLITGGANSRIVAPMAGALKSGIRAMFGALPNDDEKENNVPGFDFTWRRAMQTLGTEWGRSLDQDIWIKLQQHHLEANEDFAELFVVPDLRFDNEAEWLLANGGLLVKVVREGVDAVEAHKSESGISYTPDVVIENNGDLEQLRAQVKEKIWRRLL